MKKLYIAAFLATFINSAKAQVGINTTTPATTMHIAATTPNNPSNNSGLIIPRVKTLNTTDTKPNGLLVFLESDNDAQRGFWYWDKDNWYPFISKNMLTQDRSALIFNSKNTFEEGYFTIFGGDLKTLGFKNDGQNQNLGNCAYVDSNGLIIIEKAGKYDVSGVITLNVVADNRQRRDSYEISIRQTRGTTVINRVTSSYGFPQSGTTYNITSSVALNGNFTAQVGDKIDIQINRYNQGDLTVGDVTGATNSMITKIVPDLTNLTLRSIGN